LSGQANYVTQLMAMGYRVILEPPPDNHILTRWPGPAKMAWRRPVTLDDFPVGRINTTAQKPSSLVPSHRPVLSSAAGGTVAELTWPKRPTMKGSR
jgi:hypothetical protein